MVKILFLIGDEVSDSISWLASFVGSEWRENFSIVSKSFHIAGVREGREGGLTESTV